MNQKVHYLIHRELSKFKPFINSSTSSDWASWKFKGINSFNNHGICPFCADRESPTKMSRNKVFIATYDENSVVYSNKLKEFLTRISKYIDSKKMTRLLSLLNVNSDKQVLEMELIKLQTEATLILNKLTMILQFSGYFIDQNNMTNFEEQIKSMKIDPSNFDYFNTNMFQVELSPINEQIDNLLTMIGKLKGEVIKFKKYLDEQVKSRTRDINDFLKSAGFNYILDIVVNEEQDAHAILQYSGSGITHDVSSPESHLSWGEKNALALMLFMFDAISKNADLIILDDPISSFDSNKKYAIINRLFKTGDKDNSLYQRTVLILTHDFEPIIDYIQVGGKISPDSVNAHYLQNKNGVLSECKIEKNIDMLSSVVLFKELAKDLTLNLAVRIGCLRKYIEHTNFNPNESTAYHILSSLIHGRVSPSYDKAGKDHIKEPEMTKGINTIRKYISDFDYHLALNDFTPDSLLKLFQNELNNYFALLILRAYTERSEDARNRLKCQNDVLRKYVDETYHIENDYIYSLDVRRFPIVPGFYYDAAKEFVVTEIGLLGI